MLGVGSGSLRLCWEESKGTEGTLGGDAHPPILHSSNQWGRRSPVKWLQLTTRLTTFSYWFNELVWCNR